MLRYKEDIRTVAFVAIALSGTFGMIALHPGGWSIVPLFLAQAMAAYLMTVLHHNHLHLPTFRSKPWNRALDFALTLASGHPIKAMVVPHNINHHSHNGTEADWCSPAIAGRGWGLVRLARYTLTAMVRVERERLRPAGPKLSRSAQRELVGEVLVLIAYSAIALYLNWFSFLALNLAPWLAAVSAITAINLIQHDACLGESELERSRNFVSPLANWLMVNSGYHTAHHLHPGAHWSQLPKIHAAEVAGKIPAELSQSSLMRYIIRNYVFR